MGRQTKTFTAAAASLTTAFTSVNALLASSNVNMNVPDGYTKVTRVSMSLSPDHTSATDGCSVWKFSGDGATIQQIMSGPSWSNQAAGPLCGNNGQPVIIESEAGVFDVQAGNAIDISVGVTTAETCDLSVSLTFG